MIIKTDELKNLSTETFDFCIIGTGPAGMTVALELEATGKKILLLEGGGNDFSATSQELYKGTVIGDKYFDLDAARLRYLGGTSNHWTGWCRTLDQEDFTAKAGRPLTEWPINKSDLDKHLQTTSDILELKSIPKDRPLPGGDIKGIDFVYSLPIRFKGKYFDRIKKSSSIYLATNANVTSINPLNETVASISVITGAGKEVTIHARRYVLATGGIENSRLLLWSNQLANGALVKNSRSLGKYWMEHPHFTIGETYLTRKANFITNKFSLASFSPTKAFMDKENILNCGLRLLPNQYTPANKMMVDLMCIAPKAGKWAAELMGKKLLCSARLRAAWEMEPVASNKIILAGEKDRLGMPMVELHYIKSKFDIRTARKSAEAFGKYLRMTNQGRVKLADWVVNDGPFPENDELGGFHHMGGTRMASQPDYGVVDKNCKVHGIDNLYIAGCSVFPSGGHVNPTMTIVQIAVRLADHLATIKT